MRLGIFGSGNDAQVQAVAAAMHARGCEVALVDTTAIGRGVEHTFDGARFLVNGQDTSDVGAWYMRHILVPTAPAYQSEDGHRLFRDWYVGYMHQREHSGFQLSWLHALRFVGVPVVNPPEHGGVFQLKTFQLAAAKRLGLDVPKTCVTNSPARVREFAAAAKDVVFKPSMGGGLCEPLGAEALARLDSVKSAPVIFQERVRGTSIRATFVGSDVLSCVRIPSGELDYRADPVYSSGATQYQETTLPDDVVAKTRALLAACGLLFSGVDFIDTGERLVFLEANSSPIYLDVERKTGAPISDALVRLLLDLAHQDAAWPAAQPSAAFVRYASPYSPRQALDDAGKKPLPKKPKSAARRRRPRERG